MYLLSLPPSISYDTFIPSNFTPYEAPNASNVSYVAYLWHLI